MRSLQDRNDDLLDRMKRTDYATKNHLPIESANITARGKKQFGGFSFLKSIPLLQSLSEAQLSKLSGRLETREYDDGDMIIRQGDAGYSFFVIEAGEVVEPPSLERDLG